MKIAVDMDNTLFDEFGKAARPGIFELLVDLKKDGHELILWTSSTRDRAKQILGWHKCESYFSACYFREDYDPKNLGLTKDLRKFGADAIIDDDPQHIDAAKAIGRIGILLTSFRSNAGAPKTDELKAAYERLRPKQNWFGRLFSSPG